MLEIRQHNLEVEDRLQKAKEKLRLVMYRLPEQSLNSLNRLWSKPDETEYLHSLKHDFGPLDSYFLPKNQLAYLEDNIIQYWSFMCDFEYIIAK